jgi:Spy/CpxP family protein refolding chaperone
MKNFKAIVGIALVFALGAASGAVATHIFHRARMESFIKGGPESREEVIVSRLTRKLDLDDRQRVQVREIVHENHRAMRQVRSQYHPQIQAILDQGQLRISALLRPDQQEKFRQLIEERKRHAPPGEHGNTPGP